MTVPAGLTIPFSFEIAGSAGTFAAPDQNVKGVPIAVTRKGDRVVITLRGGQSRFEGTLASDGQMMAGEWIQGATRFPAHFSQGIAPVAKARPQTPQGPFPYDMRDVSLPGGNDGIMLAATLTIPKSDKPVAAVLLVGGNGPQNRDEAYSGHRPFLVVADRLTRSGVAVLRYDKRGVGGSGGVYAAATGDDFVDDAAAALSWLRRQPGIDPARVGILGLSEGAEIAPLVAARPDAGAAFVVLLSAPGVRGDLLMSEQARLASLASGASPASASKDGALTLRMLQVYEAAGPDRTGAVERMRALAIGAGRTPAAAAALVAELSAPDATTFLTNDPASTIATLRQPVLVLAGLLDQQVPPSVNLPPIRRALSGNRRATIEMLAGLNHVLQPAKTGSPDEYSRVDETIDERALAIVEKFVHDSSRTVG